MALISFPKRPPRLSRTLRIKGQKRTRRLNMLAKDFLKKKSPRKRRGFIVGPQAIKHPPGVESLIPPFSKLTPDFENFANYPSIFRVAV